MEFGMKRCGFITLKGEFVTVEDIKLQDAKVMKEIDGAGNKYLGILEYKVKATDMRDIFKGTLRVT